MARHTSIFARRMPRLDPSAKELARHGLSSGTPIHIRRSWRADLPLIVMCVLAFLLAVWLTRSIPGTVLFLALPSSGPGVPIPLFGLPVLLLVAVLVHRHWDALYTIADGHVQSTRGILSLRRQEMRIDFVRICGVEIVQSMWEHLLGIGTLKIGSAMREDTEIEIRGILHPSLYRNLIGLSVREERARVRADADSGTPDL